MTHEEKKNDVGGTALLLSATEVGLGSLLHAFHIPLTGQALSLNQGFLLSRHIFKHDHSKGVRVQPAVVSNFAALLKSLSPAGKKVTPMLAISSQGVLFSLGTILCGPNISGALLGSILASTWAFLQPLILYFLIYGKTLVDVSLFYANQIQDVFGLPKEYLIHAVTLMVLTKAVLAAALAVAARVIPESLFQKYTQRLLALGHKHLDTKSSVSVIRRVTPLRGAFQDLLSPIFLLSLAAVAVFLGFSGVERGTLVWSLLRPLAMGYLIFYLVRRLPVREWAQRRLGIIRRES